MIILLLLSAILVFHDLPSVLSDLGDPCTTPNNERAICTKLQNCGVIVNALSTQLSAAKDFARKSQCGYTDQPLVCCGSSGLPISNLVYQHRLLPRTNECGLGYTADKIYYGKTTGIKEFPWMALLFYSEGDQTSYECAGSLINKRYVLTAAHCVRRRDKELVSVRLGEHNTTTSRDCEGAEGYQICNSPAVDYQIEAKILHEAYRKKKNDIALLRLNRDVVFSDHIQPICIPGESVPDLAVGTNVTVAGWGATEKATESQVKLKAKLAVISRQECRTLFGDRTEITDNQYCANGFCEGDRCSDTCHGDSGSPSARLISQAGQLQWMQEGITSFGINTCGLHYPAVYTRISKYAKWITDHMRD